MKKREFEFSKDELAKFDFEAPTVERAKQIIKPFKLYFNPDYIGLSDLDTSKPAMYISNHTILGLLDGYPFGAELYIRKQIFLRSLADKNHFRVKAWADFVKHYGLVKASRRNCAALMERKESLLVFPGGTREICKKRGEAYVLKWSDRLGFVRMAMMYGYDIIPVTAVGAEEAFDIEADANDFLNTTLGKVLHFTGLDDKIFKGGELIPPKIKGLGNTIFPKPVKLYFKFGKRISTKKFQKEYDNIEFQKKIKDKVEKVMLEQFQELFEKRDHYVEKNLIKRWLLSK